jgi:hypothetical protein
MSSAIATKTLVREVIDSLKGELARAIAQMERASLHVVVLVPCVGKPYGIKEQLFDDCVVGDKATYKSPYDTIARNKAELCRRTRMDTAYVLYNAPHLLCRGDIIFPGGIYRDGLIVAVSGATPEDDVMFANTIADAITKAARDKVRELQDTVETNGIYIK